MRQIWSAIMLAALGGFAEPWAADNWGRLAVVSDTMGMNANRVCVGEASRGDIGCASTAPYVDPATGSLGLGTTAPSSTLDVVVGSARNWTPIAGTVAVFDYSGFRANITVVGKSDTQSELWFGDEASQASGRVRYSNLYESMSFWTNSAYSGLQLDNAGKVLVGVGTGNESVLASTTLHVSGTLRIADGGEACDSNRAGAIKYASSVFSFCNGSAWQTLAEAAGASSGDRITSGTTAVVANTTGYISLTTGGVTTGYFDTTGRLNAPSLIASGYPGLQLTHANGQIRFFGEAPAAAKWAVGSSGDVTDDFMIYDLENSKVALWADDITGNVGIGTLTPSKTFTVNGDADVSGTMKLAGTGSETCDTGSFGQIRLNPATGKLELCRQ